MPDEIIKPPVMPDNNFASALNYVDNRIRVKFDMSCLKQDRVTVNHEKMVNELKVLITRSTNILDMVLNLIWKEPFASHWWIHSKCHNFLEQT